MQNTSFYEKGIIYITTVHKIINEVLKVNQGLYNFLCSKHLSSGKDVCFHSIVVPED